MAQSTKKSKTGKSKAKLALGISAAIMAVFVVGYFIYFSGLLPQILPGMTITETKADGTKGKVADLSVIETNYYYMNIYSMYSQYGILNKDNLDTVINQETGQTYREMLLSQGADEALQLILMEREADSKGFRKLSAADKAAKSELESLRGIAKLYNYPTIDRYIAAQYGTGMTYRLYKKCVARGLYSDEYQSYISQFDTSIVPSDDDLKKECEKDPSPYESVDFHYYLITAKNGKDGKPNLNAAEKAAQAISDKSTDGKSFREAVMSYLKEQNDTDALKGFEDDEDPTEVTALTKASVESSYDANLSAFLFTAGRKAGDKSVVKTSTGAYVVLFDAKKLDEEKEITYRTLTLENKAKNGKTRTDEEVAADAKALAEKAKQLAPEGLDPLSFYKLVKANTSDQDEMLSGGYVAGETKADVLDAEEGKEPSAEDKALADWLFDESRKTGDIYITTASDNTSVKIYYFEKSSPAWMGEARNTKVTENVNKLKESLKSTNPQYQINSDLVKKFIYG